MNTNETDRLIVLGFNHGYVLENAAPSVLKQLMGLKHSSAYLLGLNKGQMEFQHHKQVILGNKQIERADKLKKIHLDNRGKDEQERG